MTFYPVNVQGIIDETDNVRSFILEPDEEQLSTFRYQPGQFLTLHVPQLEGDELTQSVYLSGAPTTDKLKITIKRETIGSASDWIYTNLKVGDRIETTLPSGNFNFRKSSNSLALIVDDSGIIPVLSLLKNELNNGARFIKLFYDCTNYNSIIFRQEIDFLRESYPQQFECLYHLNLDSDELHATTLKTFINNYIEADFTICGLEPHVNLTEHVLADLGIDRNHITIENCSSLNQRTPPLDKHLTVHANANKISHFKATLDGKEYKIVYLADKTLLECMLAAGLEPYFSCSDAHCGYCMAIKKSGELTMQKTNVLSPGDMDRGYVLLCQAIPLSGNVWVDCDA